MASWGKKASSFCEAGAALVLLITAAAAPWVAGARITTPEWQWWLVAGMVGAFVLAGAAALLNRSPRIPVIVWAPVALLLGCVGWWATQPEPGFATDFAREQWEALLKIVPGTILQLDRPLRLAMAAAVLLSLLTAVYLGRSTRYRRWFILTLGWSGLLVAAYSIGESWLGWPVPGWAITPIGLERFNAAFFHYSGVAACLNLAWPLLVFRTPPSAGPGKFVYIAGLMAGLAIPVIALPIWTASAAIAVAVGLFIVGVGCALVHQHWPTVTRFLPTLLMVGVAGILILQALASFRVSHKHPDGWVDRETSLSQAPSLGERFHAQAIKRGDRLIPSSSPPRETAWLTAGRIAGDHLLIGEGPGAWNKTSALYSNDSLMNSFPHLMQFAHHDLLQTAAEWGVVPAALWLLLWFVAFRGFAQGSADRQCILLALLGLALHSLVDFPLQVPALQIWTAVLLGLALAAATRRDAQRED